MQVFAHRQLMGASPSSSAQSGVRTSVKAQSSIAFAGRTNKPHNALAQVPVARPFGGASLTRRATLQVAQAAQAEVGKLISKVEIPAFIPRRDLVDQLIRWASIEVQENGMGNVGCPCKVVPYNREGSLWGFTVSFLKDGVSATDIRVAFDEEITLKHEWVGRGADGFPLLEGNSEEIDGKNFEIRKVDETPVSEPIRQSVKEFCQMLVAAINKYYAFGSCFVDDAT